jgi:TPR repeat protein
MGEIYLRGRIVSKDVDLAVAHYTRAAKLGSLEALNRIGEMWETGLNREHDFKEAVACYRKAANAGLAEAQVNLGRCYAKGEGVALNKVEAWRWLNAASAQKPELASKELEKLQASMTVEEVAEAKLKAPPKISPTK